MMRKIWFLVLVGLILLSACSQGAQAGMPPESGNEAVEVAPAATDTAITPTLPPTATPVPPTATVELPTATPQPPTPTPMPVEMIADVPYVDDGNPLHTASIYLPAEAEGPYPTLVIYHSGMFWLGDNEYLAAYDTVGRFFAGLGYAVVVPGYRLSQTDPYPAAVEDAFCALAWVHASANAYEFDTTRVATLGLDSGGNLAALTGTVDEHQRFLESCPHPLPAQPWVQGVVAIGGYYDLPGLIVYGDAFALLFQSYITTYLEGTPEDAPERYAEGSPITWVDGSEPPFAIIYNRYNNAFPARVQALDFAEALDAAGESTRVIEKVTDFWLSIPYNENASDMSPGWQPTLDDYGIPQSEAFLAELFGMPR